MAERRIKMNKVTRIEKYGAWVFCNEEMDLLRKQECLCLNCGLMDGVCKVAPVLYALCKSFNLALMMTRCPAWRQKSNPPPVKE